MDGLSTNDRISPLELIRTGPRPAEDTPIAAVGPARRVHEFAPMSAPLDVPSAVRLVSPTGVVLDIERAHWAGFVAKTRRLPDGAEGLSVVFGDDLEIDQEVVFDAAVQAHSAFEANPLDVPEPLGVVRFANGRVGLAYARPAGAGWHDARGWIAGASPSADERLDVLHSTLQILARAHAHGVEHRAISGDAVLVDGQRHVRMVDFGLATVLRGARVCSIHRALERPTCPERERGSKGRFGAEDIYQWAIFAWSLLTGADPFESHDSAQRRRRHALASLPDLQTALPGVPVGIAKLVARCARKDPTRRPKSMAEVERAFDEARRPPKHLVEFDDPMTTSDDVIPLVRAEAIERSSSAWAATRRAVEDEARLLTLVGARPEEVEPTDPVPETSSASGELATQGTRARPTPRARFDAALNWARPYLAGTLVRQSVVALALVGVMLAAGIPYRRAYLAQRPSTAEVARSETELQLPRTQARIPTDTPRLAETVEVPQVLTPPENTEATETTETAETTATDTVEEVDAFVLEDPETADAQSSDEFLDRRPDDADPGETDPPTLSATELTRYGDAARRQGKVGRALHLYHRALDIAPRNVKLWTVVGNLHANRGEQRAAIHAYTQAVRMAPRDPGARLHLGDAYRAAGRTELAVRHYEAAVRYGSKFAAKRLEKLR